MNLPFLAIASAVLVVVWNGCSVPPDWSVCECHWLDNTWFHHINMLDSYTGDSFIHAILQVGHPMHTWLLKQECPAEVSRVLFRLCLK